MSLVGCQVQRTGPVAAETLTYHLTQREFSVNEHLQLFHLRHYDLSISLHELLQETSTQAVVWTRAQPGGRFAVEAVWTGDGSSPCLAAASTIGTVDSLGRLQMRLIMPTEFRDQLKLEGAIHLVLKLTSLSDTTIPPYVGISPFSVTSREGEERTLHLSSIKDLPRGCNGILDSNESRIWQDGEVKSAAPVRIYRKSPSELLADYWSNAGRVTKTSLDTALSDPELLKSACEGLSGEERSVCRATPAAFFGIDRTIVVDRVQRVEQSKIDGEVRQIRQTASIGTEFNQSDRYASGRRDSEQFLHSYAAKLGFERFGNGFQFTTAYNRQNDLFQVTESAATQEEKASAVIDDYTVLTSEALRVPMQMSVKTCVVIHPQPAIADTTGVKIHCGNPIDRFVTESWFEIRDRQHPVGSAHLDPNDTRLGGWAKLIRGEESYGDFKRAMEDRTRTFRFQKVATTESYLSAQERERSATLGEDGGLFPGILSLKSIGGAKWTLGQRQKSVKTCAESALSHEIQSDVRSDRAIAACGCLYDVISRQWAFEDYTKDWKKKMASLETSGWKKRCVRFAERSIR